MLICVHRNRCRRRENGLGWLSLPGKSISEIGNPSSGCPTTANYGQPHGFIAREGRRVFVVTEYWQEIQRRQLPRDRCSAGEVVKHECKFCTSLVKCKTQMQRKPTIYSRHVQSKELTNYDFGKGYFGFFGRFLVFEVFFICVIIPRQFVIRKRSQINGGTACPNCSAIPSQQRINKLTCTKKWVVLSFSSQKAKYGGRLTSDMSKGQFLPQRSRAGVMAFHPSCWS